MNIEFLESMSKIKRLGGPDKLRARSLLEASEKTMETVLAMELTEATGTIIFRETYESIRQLGDALWFLKGFKPKDHEASMEILKDEKTPNSVQLQKLDRFKSIRNDANYSGYLIPKAVAIEIVGFWEDCAVDIIERIKKDVK